MTTLHFLRNMFFIILVITISFILINSFLTCLVNYNLTHMLK